MVSGLFGALRQSGYALGFAVTASLFTAVKMNLRRYSTTAAAALGFAALSMAAYAVNAHGHVAPEAAMAGMPNNAATLRVAPFGVAERKLASAEPVAAPAPAGAATMAAAAGDFNPQFDQYCIACHGPDGRGVANLGVDLVASAFVGRNSEAALVEFLKAGRLPDDPASVTGRPMPGFAWVPEGELTSIAGFLKSRSGGK